MNILKRALKICAIGVVAHSMTMGSALAAPISGTFTLAQNTPPPTNYVGDYTTLDTAGLVAGDIVGLLSFNLSSTFNPSIPAGGIALTFSDVSNVFAILGSPTSIEQFGGFVSADGNPDFALFFSPDQFDPRQGDWGLGGSPPVLALNGDLFIPEPTGLALLGAGLVAFGAVKRRKASKQSV